MFFIIQIQIYFCNDWQTLTGDFSNTYRLFSMANLLKNRGGFAFGFLEISLVVFA